MSFDDGNSYQKNNHYQSHLHHPSNHIHHAQLTQSHPSSSSNKYSGGGTNSNRNLAQKHHHHQHQQQSSSKPQSMLTSSSSAVSSSKTSGIVSSSHQHHHQQQHHSHSQNVSNNESAGNLGNSTNNRRKSSLTYQHQQLMAVATSSASPDVTAIIDIGDIDVVRSPNSFSSPIRYSPHPNDGSFHQIGSKLSIHPIDGRYDDTMMCCLPPPSPAPNCDRFIMGIPSPSSSVSSNSHFNDAQSSSQSALISGPQSQSSSSPSTSQQQQSASGTNITHKFGGMVVNSSIQRSMSPNSRYRLPDRYREISPKCERFVASPHFLSNSTPLVSNDIYLSSTVHTPVKRYVPTPPPTEVYSDIAHHSTSVSSASSMGSSYNTVVKSPNLPHQTQSLSQQQIQLHNSVSTLPYRFRMKCCINDTPASVSTNLSVLSQNTPHHDRLASAAAKNYATSPRVRNGFKCTTANDTIAAEPSPQRHNGANNFHQQQQTNSPTPNSLRAPRNSSCILNDYVSRTPSIEYIGSSVGRILTPVNILSEPSIGACLHCNTMKRTTGVHQTTQTTGPISPVPLQNLAEVLELVESATSNELTSSTSTPSTNESQISSLSPSHYQQHQEQLHAYQIEPEIICPEQQRRIHSHGNRSFQKQQQDQQEELHYFKESNEQPKDESQQHLPQYHHQQQQQQPQPQQQQQHPQQQQPHPQQQQQHPQPQQQHPQQQQRPQQQQQQQHPQQQQQHPQQLEHQQQEKQQQTQPEQQQEQQQQHHQQQHPHQQQQQQQQPQQQQQQQQQHENYLQQPSQYQQQQLQLQHSQQYHQQQLSHNHIRHIVTTGSVTGVGVSGNPNSLNSRQQLQHRFSRKQRLNQYVRKQISKFFGVDSQTENDERAIWLGRQRRFAIRRLGSLKSESELNSNNRRRHNAAQQPPTERPDILPAQTEESQTQSHINVADFPHGQHVERKASVPTMIISGMSYIVQTLNKRQHRNQRLWSRSFAPAHVTAINGDNPSDICEGLTTLQEEDVFFDSPGNDAGNFNNVVDGRAGSAKIIEHQRQIYMGERVHGWRTSAIIDQQLTQQQQTNGGNGLALGNAVGVQQQIGSRGIRISSQLLDGVLENSRRPVARKVKLFSVQDLDDRNDHRPFFTYWINTVQILVLILSLTCYGVGPIGLGIEQKTGQVLVPSLSLQTVQHHEQRNVWIGPRNSDLVHMGAKFATCMRKDIKIMDVISKTRRQERETACCIRNDDSGCVQSSQADCSVRGLFPTKSISTWKKWSPGESGPGGRISGSVCGLDPKFCDAPASIAPYEWPDDITKWPICRKTNSFSQRFRFKDHTAEHMVCEVIGHPCCTGVFGECRITTREYCDFVNGYFHEEASLCSQISCLNNVCGMFPFFSIEVPDQFYRLFTSLCLHAGILHLAITIAFQHVFLADLERLIGPIRTAIVYIGSGLAGNLTSAVLVPYKPEVGPLASLAGVIASLVVLLILIHWKQLRKPHIALFKLIVIGGILFGIGTLPWQLNFAGLVAGIFCGIFLTIALVPFVTVTKYGRKTKINLIWTCILFHLFIYTAMLVIFYLFPTEITSFNFGDVINSGFNLNSGSIESFRNRHATANNNNNHQQQQQQQHHHHHHSDDIIANTVLSGLTTSNDNSALQYQQQTLQSQQKTFYHRLINSNYHNITNINNYYYNNSKNRSNSKTNSSLIYNDVKIIKHQKAAICKNNINGTGQLLPQYHHRQEQQQQQHNHHAAAGQSKTLVFRDTVLEKKLNQVPSSNGKTISSLGSVPYDDDIDNDNGNDNDNVSDDDIIITDNKSDGADVARFSIVKIKDHQHLNLTTIMLSISSPSAPFPSSPSSSSFSSPYTPTVKDSQKETASAAVAIAAAVTVAASGPSIKTKNRFIRHRSIISA